MGEKQQERKMTVLTEVTTLKPLLPCPFCGHEPDWEDDEDGCFAFCDNKKCVLDCHPIKYDRWNERATPSVKPEQQARLEEIAGKAAETIIYRHGDAPCDTRCTKSIAEVVLSALQEVNQAPLSHGSFGPR